MNIEGNVLLDFYSDWCQPCKNLTKDLDALKSEFNDLKVKKLDIMENFELTEKYNITSVPTLILLKNDKSEARYTAYKGKDDLKKFLQENVF